MNFTSYKEISDYIDTRCAEIGAENYYKSEEFFELHPRVLELYRDDVWIPLVTGKNIPVSDDENS